MRLGIVTEAVFPRDTMSSCYQLQMSLLCHVHNSIEGHRVVAVHNERFRRMVWQGKKLDSVKVYTSFIRGLNAKVESTHFSWVVYLKFGCYRSYICVAYPCKSGEIRIYDLVY